MACLQLRDCLVADVYELFHKKLTEHALMKDPKFLWCCHVSVSVYIPCLSSSFLFTCLIVLQLNLGTDRGLKHTRNDALF